MLRLAALSYEIAAMSSPRRISRVSLLVCTALALASSFGLGCGASGNTPDSRSPKPNSQLVFELAAPSVVAILNDDRADREQEIKDLEKSMGDESHAPKKIIDVSLRKEPTPHGTGFAIHTGFGGPGGDIRIATAAHVVIRPDRLKITTRTGQTVEAELEHIDEVRDVAILRPKVPLKDVPPLPLGTVDPVVGQAVWSMGHTGHGFWALSWGMSEGIASGIVDMFGSKLLLFDAAVYPGFSGGPVVTMEADGKPHVVGVNHAILFTGGSTFPIGPISSAASLVELRATAAGTPHPLEPILSAYAKKHKDKQYADVFITDRLNIQRDVHDNQVASFMGNAKEIEIDDSGRARIPAMAMLFGLEKGKSHEITFEIHDPNNNLLASDSVTVRVAARQRVSFVSTSMRFTTKTHGKHAVTAKLGDKTLGTSFVILAREGDDEDVAEAHDADSSDDGDPDVDIVVAAAGRPEPLTMMGIQSVWLEKSYPRRVNYSWFARGTRGWSGTYVAVSGFVLDENGHIVGRSDGCLTGELRPEHTWACMGSGGLHPPPLPTREGSYDIVFTINDRPVAWWPMEAMIRQEHFPGSDVSRWANEMKRVIVKRRQKIQNDPLPPAPKAPEDEPGPPKPPGLKPLVTPPKPPVKKP